MAVVVFYMFGVVAKTYTFMVNTFYCHFCKMDAEPQPSQAVAQRLSASGS